MNALYCREVADPGEREICHAIRRQVFVDEQKLFAGDDRDEIEKFVERTNGIIDTMNIEFDEYDRLIQLCDAVALPSGFCLVEKRLMDVAFRYGVNEISVPRWKAYLEIQKEFEGVIGHSIYKVLDGVVENTFGFDPCG